MRCPCSQFRFDLAVFVNKLCQTDHFRFSVAPAGRNNSPISAQGRPVAQAVSTVTAHARCVESYVEERLKAGVWNATAAVLLRELLLRNHVQRLCGVIGVSVVDSGIRCDRLRTLKTDVEDMVAGSVFSLTEFRAREW